MLVAIIPIQFKMVNSILGTNIKSNSTTLGIALGITLPYSVLCSSFVNFLSTKISGMSDSISSK